MTNKKQTLVRLGLFLFITFSLTWIPHFICLHIWGFEKWMNSPFSLIITLTMFSPMLGNIITRLITKESWKGSRLHFHFKGNIRFYIIALLIPLIFGAISAAVVNLSYCNWKFEMAAKKSFSDSCSEFMEQAVFPLLYGSIFCFGEEFGWRGYMNDKLKALTGRTGAVIIGGIFWGLWHAPLVANGYNFGSGHPVLSVALMCVSCISMNAILMLLTEKTDSVYPAVLLHTALDLSAMTLVAVNMISGLSDEIMTKITELQSSIFLMVIPEAAVGVVFFVLLLRNKTKITPA